MDSYQGPGPRQTDRQKERQKTRKTDRQKKTKPAGANACAQDKDRQNKQRQIGTHPESITKSIPQFRRQASQLRHRNVQGKFARQAISCLIPLQRCRVNVTFSSSWETYHRSDGQIGPQHETPNPPKLDPRGVQNQ